MMIFDFAPSGTLASSRLRTWASIGALFGALLSGCGDDDVAGDAGRDGASAADSGGRDGGPGGDGGAADGGVASSFLRCPAVVADPTTGAELPRARVDTTFPTQTGTTLHVAAGEDLQAALDTAGAGDTIELEAGASFTGPFTLRNHDGDGWVVVTTDAPSLPGEGARVSPADAPSLARILAPAGAQAIVVEPLAHHYRFVGVEITTATDALSYNLVDLGSGTGDAAMLAHHFVFDRCYVHGAATAGTRRGIAMNAAHVAVIESYFTDFRESSADSQALCGWAGPGPFGIYDNYLAGAAENVMFGGASSDGPGTNPADIEVCGNHFDKPLTWYEMDPMFAGADWVNKNLFELKNARRVLLAGNVLEHSWGDGQVGFAILLTPRAEGDPTLDHAVTDVTITSNLVKDVGGGVNLSSRDDTTPGSNVSERVAIVDNLFVGIDGARWNGQGRSFQFLYGGATGHHLLVAHNTAFVMGNAAVVLGDDAPVYDDVVLRDNLLEHGMYGVFGSGQGEGAGALDHYVPGHVFEANAIFGNSSVESSYPAGNFFPADAAAVGFVDLAGGDYALAASSPYATAATDGRAVGADAARVMDVVAGVR